MKRQGFTLIELMITLALFSLFVGFLYNAYFTQIKENNSFNTRIDLKHNGDKAMNLITNELRNNVDFNFIAGGNGDINQITKTNGDILINLTSSIEPSNLALTSNNTLIDNSNLNPVVLCKGITSIKMNAGSIAKNEEDLIIITIDLQLRNDRYTVTTAVNINK